MPSKHSNEYETMMELSEELELPPWEKFRLYGKFPWKLCLHFGLVALVTALVITTNLSYAAYSRSVWLTIANVLYPPSKWNLRPRDAIFTFSLVPHLFPDYVRFQSDLSSPFQYYIYTQNQTTYDANRLFFKYFTVRLLVGSCVMALSLEPSLCLLCL